MNLKVFKKKNLKENDREIILELTRRYLNGKGKKQAEKVISLIKEAKEN